MATQLKTELKTAERIIKAKIDLNKSHPFFSRLLLNMEIEKTKHTDKIPTMGVNQYGDLWWNKEFVDSLDNEELKFVLAHEVSHVATLTFQRRKKRDHMIWNIASDLVINYMLIDEGFRPITGKYKGMVPDHRGVYTFKSGKTNKEITIDLNDKNTEQVYEVLINNAKEIKDGFGGGGQGGQGDGNYEGQMDTHIEGDNDDSGQSQGKGKTDADVKANENGWKQKTIESSTYAKMKGSLSASMERLLDNILEPAVDWRQKLFAYITNDLPVDYTMRMPSRRFISTGVYTPTVIKENLELIAGVDISGSISHEEYVDFMSELVGIANSYRQVKMRMIAWACHVDERDDVEVTNDTQDELMKCKFYGGGGTELSCLTEYIEKKEYNTRLMVILTDGYIETNPNLPDGVDCLFVLSKNGRSDIVKNYGDVTSLNDVRK